VVSRTWSQTVTVFAFAISNFNREKEEVEYLMVLERDKFWSMAKEGGFFHKNNVRLKVCGDLLLLPQVFQNAMEESMNLTKMNTRMLLNACIAYDSIFEIENALTQLRKQENTSKRNGITTKKEIKNYSQVRGEFEKLLLIEKPDIVVRTSGETRLSNFLTYQSTLSELVFVDETWPEFSFWSFFKIILQFQKNVKQNEEFHSRLAEFEVKNYSF